jgi:hypothetical protein
MQRYEGLIESINALSKLPQRYPLAPETRPGLVDREVGQFLYGKNYWKYRVLYAVEQDRVVAHVRHGASLFLGQDDPENA